ncbi:MAG: CopG family transcriptional regulator [Chloroflexi bacterium CFX6]|nr:CopG family transcriptional regulator [Chloroflexi bacterium CFX6]
MTARDLDERFDRGDDIVAHLDLSRSRRPGWEPKRVNVDFPSWMIQSLDREAGRLGVTRQSIIKLWIAERLDGLRAAGAESTRP